MTAETYTPGPWVFSADDGEIYAKGSYQSVCMVLMNGHGEANACLLTAAPDLLEACRLLIGADGEGMTFSERINRARHAIAKAEGRPSFLQEQHIAQGEAE